MLFLVLFASTIAFVASIQFDLVREKTCVLYEYDKNAVVQGTYEVIVGHGRELNPSAWTLIVEVSGYTSYHGVVDVAGDEDSRMLYRESNAPMKGSFAYVAPDGDQQICFTLTSKQGEYYEGSGINAKMSLDVHQKLVAIRHDEIKEKVGGQQAKDASAETEKALVDISEYVSRLVERAKFLEVIMEKRMNPLYDADGKITTLSALFFFVSIIFGIGQMWYLKNYFKKKRLL